MKTIIYLFITISLIVSCKSPTDSTESSDEKDYSDYSGEKVYTYPNKIWVTSTGTKFILDLPVKRSPTKFQAYSIDSFIDYEIKNNPAQNIKYDNLSVYQDKLTVFVYFKPYATTKDSSLTQMKFKVTYESLK